MGYNYELKNYYKIKKAKGTYPWPCEIEPKRTITLTNKDILKKQAAGIFIKHTGLMCFGIKIPKKDIKYMKDKPIKLQLI
ncbi:hypothetical protein ACFLQL_00610 [Verrucomicrobiota bacterium]